MKGRLKEIEKRIEKIKKELMTVGEMRPGSLTQQSRGGKIAVYYQLSYTHKMKGKTEYIRSEFVEDVAKEIAEYKRFRELIDEWISLAIERSKIKMDLAKQNDEV